MKKIPYHLIPVSDVRLAEFPEIEYNETLRREYDRRNFQAEYGLEWVVFINDSGNYSLIEDAWNTLQAETQLELVGKLLEEVADKHRQLSALAREAVKT